MTITRTKTMSSPEGSWTTFSVTTTVVAASTIDLQAHPVTSEPTNNEPPPDPRTILGWGSSTALPPDGPAILAPTCPFKTTQRVSETGSKLKNIQEATESSGLVTKSTPSTLQQQTPSTKTPEPTAKMHLSAVETANDDIPSHPTPPAVEPPFRLVMAVPGYPAVNRSDIVPTLRPYVSQAMRQGAASSLTVAIIMAVLAFW